MTNKYDVNLEKETPMLTANDELLKRLYLKMDEIAHRVNRVEAKSREFVTRLESLLKTLEAQTALIQRFTEFEDDERDKKRRKMLLETCRNEIKKLLKK